ncbi:MAG: flavin monoamine oxidase family protein, partial [Beijerinckiaceae bacterium]
MRNRSFNTPALSRRAFALGAGSLLAVRPASAEDTDVAIIGAGAAGIGAARALAAAGKRYVLIEARERAGGRLWTNTDLGQPFDAGAAYIHFAEKNPWSEVASELGVDPRGGYRLWSGSIAYRNGVALSPEEASTRWSGMRKVAEAYDEVEERYDVSLAQALRETPPEVRDLGRIQSQMAAGEDPEYVSASDWNRLESGGNRLVPGGYGALAARAAVPLGVRLGVRAQEVNWSGQLVSVVTDQGTIRARKAIVTVPVGVLKAGHIRFTPSLPAEQQRALDGMRMGALSKVALRFKDERFGFTPHQFLAEVGDPAKAMTFEAWPQETDLVLAVFGGGYARALARQGETAAVNHAMDRFVKIAGSDARKAFTGGRLVGWSEDRFALGSYAVILPGRTKAREA